MRRSFAQEFKLLLEFFKVLVGQIFKIDKFISCVFEGADNLIEFEMHCFSIAVLRVLDQEHHEEGNDRRGSVDDQLPGIGKMKRWSRENPHKDDERSSGESPGRFRGRPRNGGRRREMRRLPRKRNSAPFPAPLAFQFEFPSGHHFSFAGDAESACKRSTMTISGLVAKLALIFPPV
jgi:hypothetical protein